MAHTYYGIERLPGMTAGQRDTLIAALKALPNAVNSRPCWKNHWRIRADGDAAIFEAWWRDTDWTIAKVKEWLRSVFGVDPATIAHTTSSTAYGPLVTFSRSSVDRLRVISFGGANPTWEESRQAAVAYLAANAAAWGD